MATKAVRFDIFARDNASRTFDKVGRKMNSLDRAGASIGAAVSKGLKLGAVGAAGLGFAVLKASGDFEKSMNQVRAVSGATGQDFQDLRKEAKDLGRTTKFSASQAADGMGFLAMAGFRAHDILAAMPGVLNLASAGNMDLAQSADIASNILTGYGFKAKDTNKVVDVLAKTFTSTNTNLAQLGDAFKYAGPVAHSAGIEFEESAAAIGLMGNAGIQASMAGTSLRGAISRLLAPTDAIKGALDKLGVKVTDSHHKMLPLADIIDQLGKKGATTSDLMTIFGQRAGPAMAALIDQGAPALRNLTKDLHQAGGTVDKIAKIQMEGLNGQLVSLKSAWEGLMIEIGDLGVLKLATKGLTGVTTATRGLTGYIHKDGLPILKAFRDKFTGLIPADKLKAELRDAGGVVSDFFRGLVGGVPTHLPTPMLKAPAVPKDLARPVSQAQRFGETIRKVSVQLAKDFKPLAEASLGIGKAFIQIAAHTPAPVLQRLAEVMIATSLTKRVIGLGKAFQGLAVAMGESWIAATGPLGLAVGGVWALAWAFSAASGRGTSFGDTLSFLGEVITGPNGLWGVIKGFGSAIKWLFSPSGSGKAINDFNSWVMRKIGDLGDWIAWVFSVDGLGKKIAGSANWLIDAGGNIISGLWQGAVDKWHEFTGWLGRLPYDVISWITSGFQIGSPSKVMMPLGGDIIRGLLAGALGVAKGIGGWLLNHVKLPVLGAFTGAGSWLRGKGSGLLSGFVSGAWSIAKTLGGWIGKHVHSPITGAFSGAASWLFHPGKNVTGGFFSGLKQPWTNVKNWVSGIAGWIKAHKGPISLDRKLLHPAGVALMSGLLSGLKFGFGPVGSFVYHIGDRVTDTVSRIIASLGSTAGLGKSSDITKALEFAQLFMGSKYGWSGPQWAALKNLWTGESGWRWWAKNPSSGAYGIPQALPAGKMASAGSDWRTNPATQIKWGLSYIKSRYGNPVNAYSAWLSRSPHWYDSGGYLPTGMSVVMNGTGRKEPTAVFTAQQWETLHALAAGGGGGAVDVHVHFDDERLRDLIDVQVTPKIKASEDRQAYRAKVGLR